MTEFLLTAPPPSHLKRCNFPSSNTTIAQMNTESAANKAEICKFKVKRGLKTNNLLDFRAKRPTSRMSVIEKKNTLKRNSILMIFTWYRVGIDHQQYQGDSPILSLHSIN